MGTASDLAMAMELGVDGILCNTGIAARQGSGAHGAVLPAACEAGRDPSWRAASRANCTAPPPARRKACDSREAAEPSAPWQRISLADKPLYFVTDHNLTGGRPQLEVIERPWKAACAWCSTGTRISPERIHPGGRARPWRCAGNTGPLMLINDRVAIAKDIGADGVHLGQDDMEPQEARDMLGPDAIIGLSTHNREEVLAAADKPVDYINIGPMFPTATKDHSRYGALGTDRVLELSRLARFPFTTMGGINGTTWGTCSPAGVRTVAMVTEISLAPDAAARTRELLAEIRESRHGG